MLGKAPRGWAELVTLTAQLLLERPSLYAIPAALPFLRLGQTIYREPRPLRRASAASASVIAATWALAQREVELRRRVAERLLVELRRHPAFQTVSATSHARPGYLRLPVLASAPARRSATEPAARRLGIMPGYPQALCDVEQCLRIPGDRKSTRLNSSHLGISYAVFCLKKKKTPRALPFALAPAPAQHSTAGGRPAAHRGQLSDPHHWHPQHRRARAAHRHRADDRGEAV